MEITSIDNSLDEFLQDNAVKMISQAGKKTIFLFSNPQQTQSSPLSEELQGVQEFSRHQDIKIHKFVQERNELFQKGKGLTETSAFRAVPRETLNQRMKSNSPKNQGQFYKVHYGIIEKKTPFLAKIYKSKSPQPKKSFDQTRDLLESSLTEIPPVEDKKPPFEFAKTNHHIDFNKQLNRKELFEDMIKPRVTNAVYEGRKSPPKVYNIDFAKYQSRKEIFPPIVATEKDYDDASGIYNKINHDNSAFQVLFRYDKNSNRKFFNDEGVKIRADDAMEPSVLALIDGYCKTHKIYNTKIGCFSPKTGRERPSPQQTRILKENEKMGFDCFNKNPKPKIGGNAIRPREKKFNLQAFKREIELDMKREAKIKKKLMLRNKPKENKF